MHWRAFSCLSGVLWLPIGLMGGRSAKTDQTGGFLRYHVPLIVYAALVLAVSSIPNLKSPDVPAFLPLDKVAHFVEYAVLAFLALRSVERLVQRRAVAWTYAFTAVFAVVDEYHQKFVPGRQFDMFDLVADLAGAAAALVLILIIRRRRSGATR